MDIKCFIAKGIKILLNPPAVNKCEIDKTSKVGPRTELTACRIDRYSYIGQQCFMVNVDVGGFCSIADRVSIGGATHPIDYVSTSPVFHKGRNVLKKNFSHHAIEETKRTTIGHDVWIGQGVFIKAGVTIHNGAVVGMGSVVTKDIPPYEIWAGNPAKKIRDRFGANTKQDLLDSRWWEWSDDILQNEANYFSNVEQFLKESKKWKIG
ncbi:MAG: CatB-related O-acetyltransferase [Lachnospiraceae bacterium]|nr:CatB-related O-acetyltransferase [Lachnospiraceae bacterium]